MGEMSNKIPKEKKQEIIKLLKERGVLGKCPMCGNSNFIIADGYINNSIQGNVSGGLVIGGPSIPTIPIICAKCGFISQHAIGVLGLLNQNKEEKNDKQ